MFADYQGEYGDFGRSWGRSISRGISRSVRTISRAPRAIVRPIASATRMITGDIKGAVSGVINPLKSPLKSLATMALVPMAALPMLYKGMKDLKKMKRTAVDDGSGGEAIVYQDENGNTITEAQYNALMAKYAQEDAYMQNLQPAGMSPMFQQQSIQSNMPTITPIQQPIVQPQAEPVQNYQPQQQMYPYYEYADKQRPQQQSYYDERQIPAEQGAPMDNEFTQEQVEEYYPPEGDYGSLGIDEETAAIINEATDPNAAAKLVDAGKTYVANIQGSNEVNTTGALQKTVTNPLGSVPSWMWWALGASVLTLMLATNKPNKNKR